MAVSRAKKVPMVFLAVVLLSFVIVAYKLNNEVECNAKEFKIDAPSFMVGEFIIFSDDSKNAHSWRWYFGDDSQIAFRSKVAHSFDKEGDKYANEISDRVLSSVELKHEGR